MQATLAGFGEITMNRTISKPFGRTLLIGVMAALPLLLASTAAAQTCPTLNISYVPVHQLSVSDIDFEHFASRALLYTMVIGNASGSDISVQLQIGIDVNLADGSSYLKAVDYLSQPFLVHPGGRTITNIEIGQGALDVKTESYSYNSEARDRLQDISLGTGQFPAGRYTFNFSLNNCVSRTIVLILQNSSQVALRSPQEGESTNQFPLFEFYQEGGDVQLIVAELRSGQSREDAIARQPAMLDVRLQGQNSFFYSGGRSLEVNKTYAWQVISRELIAGGAVAEVKSAIRSFNVSSVSSGESFDDALLRQLEEILGPRYQNVFDQIRNGRYAVTGKFSNNSFQISPGELLNLLNLLRASSDTAELTFE